MILPVRGASASELSFIPSIAVPRTLRVKVLYFASFSLDTSKDQLEVAQCVRKFPFELVAREFDT